jgi:hypothetical protein
MGSADGLRLGLILGSDGSGNLSFSSIRECRGPGRASEAPAERKMGDMMLWITLGAVYLAIGAVIGLVLEDRYSRRSSAGPRSFKDYVRSACTYAFIWPILFFYGKRR